MNAPLSRYLTSFSPPEAHKLVVFEPLDNDLRLDFETDPLAESSDAPADIEPVETVADTMRREMREEFERMHAQTIAALEASHALALEGAVVAARAERTIADAQTIGTLIEGAMMDLREMLSERTAVILRPLVADAILARTLDVLQQTIVRLLADPAHPCLAVRGPRELVEALRARAPDAAGVIYETADSVEVTLSADGMHVETRLGHALSALDGLEPKA